MIWHVLALLSLLSLTTTARADASSSHQTVAPVDPSLASLPSESTQVRAVPDFFAKGSRYWSATTGASHDGSLGQIYLTHLTIGHYLVDNLAIEYGGMFGYADAKRTPAGVLGGPELGIIWHFAKGQHWSTYLEGVAGAVFQQHPLAVDTLRFNFDLQPGGGATYRLRDHTMVQSGFRWHHLSNAQVRGRVHNFGYDGPMLYLKLRKSF